MYRLNYKEMHWLRSTFHLVLNKGILCTIVLCLVAACSVTEKKVIVYNSKEPLYSAVAYVMDLNSSRLIKADIVNNDYITSYITYTMFGRINRFRLYMTLIDNVFETEVGDVQIRISRGGFESWESAKASSLIDTDSYTRKIGLDIISAARSKLYANFKDKLQRDLKFNLIVLKDLPVNIRAQWVADNMLSHNYRFDSSIDRILKAGKNKKYGKYLIKMSNQDTDMKSHINLEFYSNNPAYTRFRIGDSLSVTAKLVDAVYSDQNDTLTIYLQDSY